jgi:ubiquitin carboxyl-terminal hydrolase 22/27/51
MSPCDPPAVIALHCIALQGDISGGHYVAYVRSCGAWFCCDDAWVTLVSEAEVLAAQAYMLFYVQQRYMAPA